MGLYYQESKNKGADQLRGYHAADLHLCFGKCKNGKNMFSCGLAYLIKAIKKSALFALCLLNQGLDFIQICI